MLILCCLEWLRDTIFELPVFKISIFRSYLCIYSSLCLFSVSLFIHSSFSHLIVGFEEWEKVLLVPMLAGGFVHLGCLISPSKREERFHLALLHALLQVHLTVFVPFATFQFYFYDGFQLWIKKFNKVYE